MKTLRAALFALLGITLFILGSLLTLTAPIPSVAAPVAQATCGAPAWSFVAPYPLPIVHPAVVAFNGYLYSFGGYNPSGAKTNAYRYDPATNAWQAISGLPQERTNATPVTDGTYIYLVGGRNNISVTNTLLRYDPTTDQYSALATMPTVTWLHTSTYWNGKIYSVAGCAFTPCAPNLYVNQLAIYDVVSDTWSTGAGYYSPMAYLMSTAFNGYVYALGGVNNEVSHAQTYRYDPLTNTWDDAAIADFPEARWGAAVGTFNGNQVVAGGYTANTQGNYVPDGHAYSYDAGQNTWSAMPAMPAARALLGGATVGEAFYAVGGQTDWGVSTGTTDVQRFGATCQPTSIALTAVQATTATNFPWAALIGALVLGISLSVFVWKRQHA